MKNYHHNVFDLGILYDPKIVQRLFRRYCLAKDRPEETSLILEECNCQHTKEVDMSVIWDFVRWGSSAANEYVGIAFGHDGKLKLLIGWDHKNSRYTAKAVSTICKKVILIIAALQKHGVIYVTPMTPSEIIKRECEEIAQ